MSADRLTPLDGYYVLPRRQNFEETIIFIHQWGGHRSFSKPYMNFVAELGFKSYTFNQSFHSKKTLRFQPKLLPDISKGLRHVWTREITQVLDALPGPKILYSFSLPSGAALKALGDRKAKDISAWICDGGPFFQLHRCYRNYFTHQSSLKNPISKEIATLGSYLVFGAQGFKKDMKNAIDSLPEEFPILSVRGWQDPLVPTEAIEEVFAQRPSLNVEILALPEGGHIDGLKRHPEEFKPRLKRFLEKVGSKTGVNDVDR